MKKWDGEMRVRTWSHQHSEKLGSWCSRLYSRNSNITLMIMHIHQSRIISVCEGTDREEKEMRGGREGGHFNTSRIRERCAPHGSEWRREVTDDDSEGSEVTVVLTVYYCTALLVSQVGLSIYFTVKITVFAGLQKNY